MAVNEAILEVVEGPFKASLFHDGDAESPRTWSNLSTMVCWHGRYNLGDLQPKSSSNGYYFEMLSAVDKRAYNALSEADARGKAVGPLLFKILEEHYVITPLYLYDHSGITISTGPFGDLWDSGQVGFAYIRLDTLHADDHGLTNERGGEPTPEQVREWAVKVIEGEVEAYDEYLRGEVFGYVIEDAGGEQVDSLWGMFGMEYAERTMREALAGQVKALAEVRAEA